MIYLFLKGCNDTEPIKSLCASQILGPVQSSWGSLCCRLADSGHEIKFDQESLRDCFSLIVMRAGSASSFQNSQPRPLPAHQAHLICLGALWGIRHMTCQDTSGPSEGVLFASPVPLSCQPSPLYWRQNIFSNEQASGRLPFVSFS